MFRKRGVGVVLCEWSGSALRWGKNWSDHIEEYGGPV